MIKSPLNAQLINFGNEYRRTELVSMLSRYSRVRDVIGCCVKSKGKLYLPHPSPNYEDEEPKRYEHYIARAVFVPYARRTVSTLTGQVFIRKPEVSLPASMEYLKDDVAVNPLSLQSLAQLGVFENISVTRGAFFVQYNDSRCFIDLIKAEDILTWSACTAAERDSTVATSSLAMVMVRVYDETFSKDFTVVQRSARLIHMRLDGNGNVVQRQCSARGNWSGWSVMRINGAPAKQIPLYIFGSVTGAADVDVPEILELCDMNISHYRTTADHEELIAMLGQPTLWASGITDEWYNKVLKGELRIGATNGVPLPTGANIGVLQLNPHQLTQENLDKKEKAMVAIGARMILDRQIRRTATEVSFEDGAYHSTLSSLADNVSQALRSALMFVAIFHGESPDSVTYKLQTDFSFFGSTPEGIRLLIDCFKSEIISYNELRSTIRQVNNTLGDDAEALVEIDQRAEKMREQSLKMKKEELALSGNNPDNNDTKPPAV